MNIAGIDGCKVGWVMIKYSDDKDLNKMKIAYYNKYKN